MAGTVGSSPTCIFMSDTLKLYVPMWRYTVMHVWKDTRVVDECLAVSRLKATRAFNETKIIEVVRSPYRYDTEWSVPRDNT